MNPLIIRAGDFVKVTKPQVVTRVGYPKTPSDYYKLIDQHAAEIEALCYKILGKEVPQRERSILPSVDGRLKAALGYELTGIEKFGGKERRVRTTPDERYQDKTYQVISTRCVMEGDYYPPESYDSYWGESDYSSGGLDNRKVRKLVCLEANEFMRFNSRGVEFPVECVQKVMPEAYHEGWKVGYNEETKVSPYKEPYHAACWKLGYDHGYNAAVK